jgi:hypothetical protein
MARLDVSGDEEVKEQALVLIPTYNNSLKPNKLKSKKSWSL